MPASRFTPSPLSRRLAGISLVLALAMPLSVSSADSESEVTRGERAVSSTMTGSTAIPV